VQLTPARSGFRGRSRSGLLLWRDERGPRRKLDAEGSRGALKIDTLVEGAAAIIGAIAVVQRA